MSIVPQSKCVKTSSKTCIKCNISKDTTMYYKGRNACKSCRYAYLNKRRLEKYPKKVKCILTEKPCTSCEVTKPVKDYYITNGYSRNICKVCYAANINKKRKKTKNVEITIKRFNLVVNNSIIAC